MSEVNFNSQASLRHDKFSKSQKPVAGLAVLRSNIPVADYATSQASLRHHKFSKSKKPVAGLAVLQFSGESPPREIFKIKEASCGTRRATEQYFTFQASLRHGKFSKSQKPVAGLAVIRSNISTFQASLRHDKFSKSKKPVAGLAVSGSNILYLSKMPVKREIPFDHGHFFITFTCHNWLQLIAITNSYDLVYNWFDVLKSKGHFITGYVIMPNHIHATIAFRKTNKSINKIIGDGKRFIGYEIIKRLKENKQFDLLRILENAVNGSDKKRGKLHEVWEDSFDWKECNGSMFTLQKLNYMHMNPCTGKWMLAANPSEYEHSSACFYISGEQGKYEILNFGELDDINLTIAS